MQGKSYQLQIDHHPSGNRTLKQREPDEAMWTDVKAKGVLANGDEASFYKAVSNYVVELSKAGHIIVSLIDTSDAA